MLSTCRRSLVVILLICAQAEACGDSLDDGYACGGVGCDSSFELFTPIALSLEVVQKAEIKVCRNSRVCHTGKFSVDSGIGKDGRAVPKRTTATIIVSSNPLSPERIHAEVVPSGRSGVLALDVSWHWDWSTTPDARHDQYDISIEADGATLYSTHHVVDEYHVFQPNGAKPPCGGLTCGQASAVDEQLLEEIRQQRGQDVPECNGQDAGANAC